MKTALLFFAALVLALSLSSSAQVGGGGISAGGGGGGTAGTWTPVLSNSNNVASMSPSGPWYYNKVGAVVTFSGQVLVGVTSNGLSTDLHATLPVATAITLAHQLSGSCAVGSGTQTRDARLQFEAPGIHLDFTSTDTSTHTYSCVGMYLVQ